MGQGFALIAGVERSGKGQKLAFALVMGQGFALIAGVERSGNVAKFPIFRAFVPLFVLYYYLNT